MNRLIALACTLVWGVLVPDALVASPVRAAAPVGMVLVRSGSYTPIFRSETEPARVRVPAFYLDATPVTNADFLAFVRAHPAWQRGRARALFVDDAYLRHWPAALVLAPGQAQQPVVNVSWFAAMAYARWAGKRLPSVAEWERAAAAGTNGPDGRREAAYTRRILAWYSRPTPAVLPRVGATPRNYWGAQDLHGLVWEWTADFNSALMSTDSRAAGDPDGRLFCGAGATAATDALDYAAFLRSAYRAGLEAKYAVPNLGFRLALDAPATR